MVLPRSKKSGLRIEYLADCREVIPVVAGWIYSEWSFLYPEKSIDYIEKIIRRRAHKNRVPFSLVAFKGAVPAGTVSLKKFDMDTRRNYSPWVTSLYIVRQWRKTGIGTALMKTLEEKAREMKFRTLFLFTIDDLVPFYLKRGWQVKEKVKYRSYPVAIMEKNLITE